MSLFYKSKSLLVVLFFTIFHAAQAQMVATGVVTSSEDNEPMSGVTVLEKGTNNGIVSDNFGNFTLPVATGATLVFSYVGTEVIEMAAAEKMTVVLKTDATFLTEQVVTATRQPVRKLEATSTIDIVSNKQLQNAKPESLAEAVRNVPGIFITNAQGRTRGGIFVRGFPDYTGNGLVYTTLLVDGLPTLATPARPPDFNFGFDLNVDKVEVVRGAAATLFGRAAAAGVINAVSKTGGLVHAGEVRLTNYNKNVSRDESGLDYKMEANFNGPLSQNVRYNVGGFYFYDRGFRDLGAPDKGGQIRGNVDFLLGKNNNIRLYGLATSVNIQNMIDIPYSAATLKPKDGWKTTDSYSTMPGLADINFRIPTQPVRGALGQPVSYTTTRNVGQSFSDANYAKGFHIGAKMDFDLGGGWSISEHIRYQDFNEGTKFNLGASTYFNDKNPLTYRDPKGLTAAYQFRIIIDGDGKDKNIMNETRFNKSFNLGNSAHKVSLGFYYSREDYTPETWSWNHWATADRTQDSFRFGSLSRFFAATTLAPEATRLGGRSRIEHYYEDVNAFFVGDEMKIGKNLSVTASLRYDQLNLQMDGYNDTLTVVERDTTHADYSFSIGANYLINERSAFYGGYTRAFRMPDYSAYTVLRKANNRFIAAPDGIKSNEIVNNIELGYRTGFGDFGIDVAGFYTTIANRLAVFYDNGVAVSKPVGNNTIKGLELGITYTPSAIKGLTMRANATYSKGTFDEYEIGVQSSFSTALNKWVYNIKTDESLLYGFKLRKVDSIAGTPGSTTSLRGSAAQYYIDLKGKQIPGIPALIYNFVVNYDSKYFGINANWNAAAEQYFDATNFIKAPIVNTVNAGVYGKFKIKGNELRIDFLVKNLINSDDIFRYLYVAENDIALKQKQLDPTFENSGFVSGIPQLPRRFLVALGYKF
jgi:iron complex outermembrane recepter protein